MVDIEHEVRVDPDIQRSCEFYTDDFTKNAGGPQFSGLTSEAFADAWNDPNATWIGLENSEGIKWPLLVPISRNIDYRAEFFDEHFDGEEALYLSLPSDMSQSDLLTILDTIREKAAVTDGKLLVTYDFTGEDRKTLYDSLLRSMSPLMDVYDVTPLSEAFGQEYGLPKVIHFDMTLINSGDNSPESITIVESIERSKQQANANELPIDGAAIVTTEHLEADSDKLVDEVWNMYKGQFEELVEDHPSLQIQPKEELIKMIKEPSSLNIACFESGEIVAFIYFVTNIGVCPWLKEDFYKSTAGSKDEQVLYFPGIVVRGDKARQGANYVPKMLEVSNKVLLGSDVSQDARITFQCTNVSATYIPKIVSDFIAQSVDNRTTSHEASDEYGVFRPIAEYDYKVVSIG